MKRSLYLIALVALAALASCSSPHPDLLRADSIIESAPDSALAIVQSIDPSRLRSEADRALHALLLTQARVKCDIPIPSDSLISAAQSYYSSHRGPDSMLMRASFYQGVVQTDINHYAAAINPLVCAREIAVRAADDYWRAKAAEAIADIYDFTYYRDSALVYRREAADYYQRAGKIRNHRFALADLGGTLIHNKHKRGVVLLDSIYKVSEVEGDSTLMYYSGSRLLTAQLYLGNDADAIRTSDIIADVMISRPLSVVDYADKALIALQRGDDTYLDSFLTYCETTNVSREYRPFIFQTLSKIYRHRGNVAKSAECLESVLVCQNNSLHEALKQSVVTSQRDYAEQRLSVEKAAAHLDKMRTILIAATIILALVGIVGATLLRIRFKNQQLDERVMDLFRMSEQIKAMEQRNLELSEHVQTAFRQRWNVLNYLCGEYFNNDGSHVSRIAIVKNIEAEIAKIRSENSCSEIIESVNQNMDGIVERLRCQCPFLRPDEVELIAMMFAGFGSKSICLFLDMKLKSFYTKRSRLIARIAASSAPDKDRFISLMQ